MSAELVFQRSGGDPFTTSLVIAQQTGNEHASVIRLVRENLKDLNEVGRVRFEIQPFETAGGVQRRDVAELDEPAAALLMTYFRNSPVVKDFKKRLVAGFYAMRQQLTRTAAVDLSDPLAEIEAANARSQRAVEIAKQERAARIEAESQARALAVPASAWNELAEAAGDYSVADAAKVLSRDPNIRTGERRLFQTMSGLGWIFRRDGRWRAYQTQIENGRLTEKVGKPFWHEGRGELVNADPIVRITPKGLGELHKRLGGTSQLALVAVS